MALDVQTAKSNGGRRWRYLPRTWRGWLGTIAAVVVVSVLIMYLLARMTPGWYQPLDPTSNQVIDAGDPLRLSANFHNLVEQISQGDRRWSISQYEINSALALKFQPVSKVSGEGGSGGSVPAFSSPFILLEPGMITGAIRSSRLPGGGANGGGVASVRFSVQVQPGVAPNPPMGLILIDGIWVGELRIPQFLVAGKIRAYMPEIIRAVTQATTLSMRDSSKIEPEIDATITAISEGRPFPLRFKYDRRVVIVKQIEVDEGVLSVLFGPETPAVVPPEPGSLQQPGLVVPN